MSFRTSQKVDYTKNKEFKAESGEPYDGKLSRTVRERGISSGNREYLPVHLLGTSLLYANSGTTNLDGLYIITSISDVSPIDL